MRQSPVKPLRVLAIFAHPDDESLLSGGTLAACARRGADVVILSLTHGEQGPIHLAEVSRESLGRLRESELHQAAEALGASRSVCLDFSDGELPWEDTEDRLVEVVHQERPDVVITFGPEGWYWHPDHVSVHRAVMAALERVAADELDPWVYWASWPQGVMEALVAASQSRGVATGLWGLHPEDFGVPPEQITTVVDVRHALAAKLLALRSHQSQLDREHLIGAIPDDLAEEYLGREYFTLARAPDGGHDLLGELTAAGTLYG